MNRPLYLNDNYRTNDLYKLDHSSGRINSKIEFYNDSGELIWEPLHNKTVIAGSALTAMKLFNLDKSCLDNTPTYEEILGGLDNGNSSGAYPVTVVTDSSGAALGSIHDESQRKIIGFCVGQGGAGLDISDVFDTRYCDCIYADDIIPFRYPLESADDIDENIYKGKKTITLTNGQRRAAYYFKTFSNTPILVQNYVSTAGSYSDIVSKETVYNNNSSADSVQSYVELHLKITKDDCRDFFIAHKGLETAKINQISLVSAWEKSVEVTKLDKLGNYNTSTVEYFQDIRPFSLINIPNEVMSDKSKSISIIYTLYF